MPAEEQMAVLAIEEGYFSEAVLLLCSHLWDLPSSHVMKGTSARTMWYCLVRQVRSIAYAQ